MLFPFQSRSGKVLIQILDFLAWPSNFLILSLLFSVFFCSCSTVFKVFSTLHSKPSLEYRPFVFITEAHNTQCTSLKSAARWIEALDPHHDAAVPTPREAPPGPLSQPVSKAITILTSATNSEFCLFFKNQLLRYRFYTIKFTNLCVQSDFF